MEDVFNVWKCACKPKLWSCVHANWTVRSPAEIGEETIQLTENQRSKPDKLFLWLLETWGSRCLIAIWSIILCLIIMGRLGLLLTCYTNRHVEVSSGEILNPGLLPVHSQLSECVHKCWVQRKWMHVCDWVNEAFSKNELIRVEKHRKCCTPVFLLMASRGQKQVWL